MNNWPVYPEDIKTQEYKKLNLFLYEQMFGALSQDGNSLLSRISVANSSFSIDPSTGCPMGCAYCVAGSNKKDAGVSSNQINLNKVLPKKITPIFKGRDLMEALHHHSAFLPGKSVISISTGSSEPFLGCNSNNSWEIFEYLIENRLKNPVWIVTKAGIPNNLINIWKRRFEKAVQSQIPIIISLTYSNMPGEIEPYQGDRISCWKELKNTGIRLSHHLRPIIRGINDNKESVKKCLRETLPLVENVCIGGLRLDPGIILAWKYKNNLSTDILPSKPGIKDMPENFEILVKQTMKEFGIIKPVFLRSSEVISAFLNQKDYNLYQYRRNLRKAGSIIRVPLARQKEIEVQTGNSLLELVEKAASRVGLSESFVFEQKDDEIFVVNHKDMTYQTERVLIHSLGHLQIL